MRLIDAHELILVQREVEDAEGFPLFFGAIVFFSSRQLCTAEGPRIDGKVIPAPLSVLRQSQYARNVMLGTTAAEFNMMQLPFDDVAAEMLTAVMCNSVAHNFSLTNASLDKTFGPFCARRYMTKYGE